VQAGRALSLDEFAALTARLEAGLPRASVLAGADLSEEDWQSAQRTWLERMAKLCARGNNALHRRFLQRVAQHDSALAKEADAAKRVLEGPAPAAPEPRILGLTGRAPRPAPRRETPQPALPRVQAPLPAAASPPAPAAMLAPVAAPPPPPAPPPPAPAPAGPAAEHSLSRTMAFSAIPDGPALPFPRAGKGPEVRPGSVPAGDAVGTGTVDDDVPPLPKALPFQRAAPPKRAPAASPDRPAAPTRPAARPAAAMVAFPAIPAHRPPTPAASGQPRPPPPRPADDPLARTLGVDDLVSPFKPQALPFKQAPGGPTPSASPARRDALPFRPPAAGALETLDEVPGVVPSAATPFRQGAPRADAAARPRGNAGLPFRAGASGAAPGPELSLERYAWLCAMLELYPARAAEVLRSVGLDEAGRARVDAAWRDELRRDPQKLRVFAQARSDFFQRGR
jgi:hypothetical protein